VEYLTPVRKLKRLNICWTICVSVMFMPCFIALRIVLSNIGITKKGHSSEPNRP